MKKIPLLLALVLVSALVALAQDAQQEKTALYTKFIANIKGDTTQQKLAYEQGKEYLSKYGADNDQYVAYIKKWNGKYEKVARDFNFDSALAAKDWAKSFAAGKEILKADGESFVVLTKLVEAGYRSAAGNNTAYVNESIDFAKKALAMLQSGQLTDPAPFKTTDDAAGFLNYTLGWFVRDTAPAEAASLARKAAVGAYKNEPSTYLLIASTTIASEYEPQAKEYNEKFSGKELTPEAEAMSAKVKSIADRVIDAYARAAALLTKPEQQESRKQVMTELSDLYKTFNNNSDVGLNELIASVLSKPLP